MVFTKFTSNDTAIVPKTLQLIRVNAISVAQTKRIHLKITKPQISLWQPMHHLRPEMKTEMLEI